ncbi:unnamed protein product [Blepharisma stoltei]|uniref:Uncharacterized protein n=1 Tax=Blepharisma stoltei TaxID=1481888 RepID=A0AAU9JX39_9CILI|nr:unnamed protein product [Blepharisma stoltei]
MNLFLSLYSCWRLFFKIKSEYLIANRKAGTTFVKFINIHSRFWTFETQRILTRKYCLVKFINNAFFYNVHMFFFAYIFLSSLK